MIQSDNQLFNSDKEYIMDNEYTTEDHSGLGNIPRECADGNKQKNSPQRATVRINPEQDALTEEQKEKIRTESPYLSEDDLEKIYNQHMLSNAYARAAKNAIAKEKELEKSFAKDFNKKRNHTLMQVAAHLISYEQVAGFYNNDDDAKTRNSKMDELGEDIRRKYDLMTELEEKINRKVTEKDIAYMASIMKQGRIIPE